MKKNKSLIILIIGLFIFTSCGDNKKELLTSGIWGRSLNPNTEVKIKSKGDSIYYADFHFQYPYVFREDGKVIFLKDDGYIVYMLYEVSGNKIIVTYFDTIIEERLEYGYLKKRDTIPLISTLIFEIIVINDSNLIYDVIGGENYVSHEMMPIDSDIGNGFYRKSTRIPIDSLIGNRIYYKKIYDIERMKYYLTDDWLFNNKYEK